MCPRSRRLPSILPLVFLVPHFPDGLEGKESACNVGDPGSIPGSGSSPGERKGNPFQYSCLENFIDKGT